MTSNVIVGLLSLCYHTVTVTVCSLCIHLPPAEWFFSMNVFLFFVYFQMASGLQSWVEDHSNITMFNFIAYPIFSKHHDTDSKHPEKLSRAKIISLSHLKEHNCLSLIQLQKKNKKEKKNSRNLVVSKWTGGENCAFLPWPWSGIVVSENTNTPPPLPSPGKHVLHPHHTQVWVKVNTWQWSLYSFWPRLFLILFYFYLFFLLVK